MNFDVAQRSTKPASCSGVEPAYSVRVSVLMIRFAFHALKHGMVLAHFDTRNEWDACVCLFLASSTTKIENKIEYMCMYVN